MHWAVSLLESSVCIQYVCMHVYYVCMILQVYVCMHECMHIEVLKIRYILKIRYMMYVFIRACTSMYVVMCAYYVYERMHTCACVHVCSAHIYTGK